MHPIHTRRITRPLARCRFALAAALISVTSLGTAQAQDLHQVPADYTTIQAAIDASDTGDTVLVAPGIYDERINFNGKDIQVISAGGPAVTVIDGNDAGTVVIFEKGEPETALLEGFTIRGGHGTFRPAGGIYCGVSEPTIKRCIITGNRGSDTLGGAGGIMCSYASPWIRVCTIRDNVGGNLTGFGDEAPGGIGSKWDSYPVVLDSLIEENTGNVSGPGALLADSGGRIRAVNTIFRGNVGGDSEQDNRRAGPGVGLVRRGNAFFINCTLEDNRAGAGTEGPGVLYIERSGVSFDSCLVVENVGSTPTHPSAPGGPGGLLIDPGSAILTFTEFRGNVGGRSAPGAIQTTEYSGPEVRDCSFIENRGGHGGTAAPGAIRWGGAGESVDLVLRCVFRGNVGGDGAADGGAGAIETARTSIISDSVFEMNQGGTGTNAFGGPGALSTVTYGQVSVTGCRMLDNRGGATQKGPSGNGLERGGAGAVRARAESTRFLSCLFASNEGGSSDEFSPGPGAMSGEEGVTEVINCTLAANRAGIGPSGPMASGIFSAPGSELDIVNSILWNDPATPELSGPLSIRRSLVRGGAGPTIIDRDPLFVDEANGDFHLKCASPCHDAGTLNEVTLTFTDIDGDPRILGLALDIGADEYDGQAFGANYCTATVNSTGSAAVIQALGCNAISDGILPLRAGPVPDTFGAFFYGANQTQVPFANGFRCVGGQVYRLAFRPISGGQLEMDLHYDTPPQVGGQITSGSTWNFQAYFRDPQGGGALVNLSSGLQVTFAP